MGSDGASEPDLVQDRVDVAAVILRTISDALGQTPDSLGMSLRLDDLGVDSYALAEMVLELEDQFDFEFSPEEVDALAASETIDQVIKIVCAARGSRVAGC